MRPRRVAGSLLALAALATTLVPAPAGADPGPYSGGPNHYFTTSDGDEIALTVVLPHGYKKGRRYPTILEMAGYENGSTNAIGSSSAIATLLFAVIFGGAVLATRVLRRAENRIGA